MKERELIKQLQLLVGGDCSDLLQGIGDDCAVISKTRDKAWLAYREPAKRVALWIREETSDCSK